MSHNGQQTNWITRSLASAQTGVLNFTFLLRSAPSKGIKLLVEGSVSLQLSARSIGLFEAFYSSLKPVQLISQEFEVCPGGKFANGVTEIPFEFVLKANNGEELFDTYHGVYVNVQYMVTANMTR
jgi:hypothetical protein